MQDRPSADELLEALAEFLDAEVVPAFEGRKRFHAIVAANVARITAREFRLAPLHRDAETAELRRLLSASVAEAATDAGGDQEFVSLNAELVRRIEKGDADDGAFRTSVLAFLRRATERKLAIDDPKRLGGR